MPSGAGCDRQDHQEFPPGGGSRGAVAQVGGAGLCQFPGGLNLTAPKFSGEGSSLRRFISDYETFASVYG